MSEANFNTQNEAQNFESAEPVSEVVNNDFGAETSATAEGVNETEAGVSSETRADAVDTPEAEAAAETTGEAEEIGEFSELDQALLQLAEVQEQLARRNADYYNLQQEYNGYVKRSKAEIQTQYEAGISKVLEALFGVLDNAALARAHNDLDGTAGKIVEELEQTLLTNFKLERFGAEGDAFDPQVHEALMHQTSADVTEDRIAQLIQAGYKQGEKILRPARVGVVSPE